MTDIQRLQLKYERGLRCVYNGVSLRGVIVGIKKLKGQVEPNKQANDSGLDYGIEFVPEPEVTSDPDPEYTEKLEADLREKNKQYTELQIEHENMKERFEEMRKALKEMQSQGYPELKLAYAEVKDRAKEMANEKCVYYKKWYATLTDIEKKEEDIRKYNEGACRSESRIGETCWEREYEKIEKKLKSPPQQPAKCKSIIDFIDDSDDEDEALKEKNKKYREREKENDNLKKSNKDSDARYWKQYYETLDLNDTISDILTEEQRDEVKKILQEKAKYRSKVEDERKKPKPVKTVLSIIDDSDDEDEGPTIKIKDHKIIKAIECECDFLD
jgi:hypothetical protein